MWDCNKHDQPWEFPASKRIVSLGRIHPLDPNNSEDIFLVQVSVAK
jgi:hypothetical protein